MLEPDEFDEARDYDEYMAPCQYCGYNKGVHADGCPDVTTDPPGDDDGCR